MKKRGITESQLSEGKINRFAAREQLLWKTDVACLLQTA